MKRISTAVAAAVGLAAWAGAGRADFGGPPPGAGYPTQPQGYGPPQGPTEAPQAAAKSGDRYGLTPCLRTIFWSKKRIAETCSECGGQTAGGKCSKCGHGDKSCGGGRCGAGGGAGAQMPTGPGAPGTPGAQMPGTLVFPQHPYARGPRDYFMWEPGR